MSTYRDSVLTDTITAAAANLVRNDWWGRAPTHTSWSEVYGA